MVRRALLLSTSLVCAWSAPLLAADDIGGAAGGPADIVVLGEQASDTAGTGSKTAVDPRDVPAAIAVVPQQIIAQQAAHTLDETLTNASAVAPVFGGGYGIADNYVVRGLPVRFLRDGLPDGNSFNGYRRTLEDIAAVEVLKGPGSALYGRGEAGGTINVVTKAPRESWGADAEASYGRFDSLYLTGDVGGPLAQDIASRLIGHYEHTDGFRGLQRRFVDVLPTVAVELGADNRLTLDYDYRDMRTRPDNYGVPFTVNRALAPIEAGSRLYSPFNRADQTIHRFTIADTAQVSPILQLRGALIYDTRELSLVLNAGGNVVNAAGVMTGRNGRVQHDDADYWTGQAEAVLTPRTGVVMHTILFGVEYSSADIDTVRRSFNLPNLTVTGGTVVAADNPAAIANSTLSFDRAISSDTLSIYAQEQADIADRVKVRAGLRYDAARLVDHGIANDVQRRIAGSPGLLSWQVGAVFKASEALSFYGGYGKGKFVAINTESVSLS
ncbi:MAG TPA: TonB-dependent receptor, partial [Sphingomonas sp.]|nr:TonB-dependent receptor [Sphingomonas sp.]